MARSKETKIELTAYDDLFETDQSREEAKLSKIRDISIAELTEEECADLIKVLELKNKLTDLEMQSVYFCGCYDSVGYLKKAGIL